MKKWLALTLVISVLINVILVYSLAIKMERLNTSWYRLTSNFANSIHNSTSNTSVIDTVDGIASQYQGLKNIQQQLFNMQLLPEGNVIIEENTIKKSETLLQYQFIILERMKQELKENGSVSNTTNENYMKAEQSWDAVFQSFSGQLKNVNPLARTFNENKWQALFETAFKAKDSVQLTPLSP
ncbi:hypothetical protein Desaci_3691 [Desulfosporosinus acidiphilus SJ4]|uniref:Uncharacterized protein n=1 Tax=Desulfosporosinus acidiphilus (strain DSM 22704 / JCM 16185 / SJ4) TaxID=646529 RepID=I4D9U8_DESAJ|nr:hypothetical protein [Desulfosporosinus acidiphilus]AFM42572.1 hypothetical protein Desaci_3691 [Desulfosporosinus acidiphilus SJ4]